MSNQFFYLKQCIKILNTYLIQQYLKIIKKNVIKLFYYTKNFILYLKKFQKCILPVNGSVPARCPYII